MSGQCLRLPYSDRAKSLPDLDRLEERQVTMSEETDPEVTLVVPKPKRPRRCHQCHAPLDEEAHVGLKAGVGVCTLPHWEFCPGDIPEGEEAKGKLWAPCPDSSTSDDTDQFDDTLDKFEDEDD